MGWNNAPNEEQIENLHILAEGMEKVRSVLDNTPILVTSGFRNLQLNRYLKSKDKSQHLQGLACDFRSNNFSISAIMKRMKDSNIEFDQCLNEFGSWVHISFAKPNDKPRRQMLLISKNGVLIYE